ncbi:MAG: hypothetical protein RL328_1613 [Acidobacteriota bacterium]
MFRRLVVLLALGSAAWAQPASLNRDLAKLVKSHKVPGAAVVVFSKDRLLGTGVAGVRESGKPQPIRLEDRFHIGSNAKAMLATAVAMLVESGQLRWNVLPPDVLQLADAYPSYADSTLLTLLNHHAGFAAYDDTDSAEWKVWAADRQYPALDPLLRFATFAFKQIPPYPPGKEYHYSNAGFSIAGAMVERVTGMPWTTFLQQRLFGPLNMDAGFGWPTQVLGHEETKSGVKLALQDPLPPELLPAGDVQIDAINYAKFLQFHLKGLAGSDSLLKASTVKFLHTPTDGVGLGWGIRDFEGAVSSVHSGSAGTYYAVTVLQPSRDLGVAILVNSGGERASALCSEAANLFVKRFRQPRK